MTFKILGEFKWDWKLEQWCGKAGPNFDGDVHSSGPVILVYFRADQWETERGFKLEYYSEPKNQIVYSDPEFRWINYILFIVFAAIIFSIVITTAIVTLLRARQMRLKAHEPPHEEYVFQSELGQPPEMRLKSAKKPKSSGLRRNRIASLANGYIGDSAASTPVFGRHSMFDHRENVIAQNIAESKNFYTNECSDSYIFRHGSNTSITTAL